MKWLAPEQVGLMTGEKRIYTKATDVWSYGITVWEIFSKGRQQIGVVLNRVTAQMHCTCVAC